ncbi:MAG: MAPEG family protein [Proteobacteria bacterium]|nr:MAPEG family protein [Pseudomonadota bacterium]
MFYKPLLIPLLALVFLTFLVWVYMYVTRVREIKRKSIDPQSLDTRVHSQALLTDSGAQADNLKNLFELPVLFYVAVLLTLVLMIQDQLLVQLVWGYVALRYVHSLVHCTYNRVMHRFIAYAASCLVLMLIWARLAAYVLMH